MEIQINGFANISDTSYNLLSDNDSVLVASRSATGKTTIAKILYAFLAGEIRTDMIAKDRDTGVAELVFRGRTYRISLTRSGEKHIDKVINSEYAQYLVLTEAGPMYAFYHQPDKFDLNAIVDKVVEKPDIRDIEEEMRRIEQTIGSAPKLIKEYEEMIPKHESELAEVERRLDEIEKRLEKAASSEKLEVILKKRKLEDDLRMIEEQIKKYEDEVAKISAELQAVNYEELRRRAKRLGEEVEKLEKLKLMYSNITENLRMLRDSLKKLTEFADVLADMNVYLFGSPIDPQIIESYVRDCDLALEEVMVRIGEVEKKLAEVRMEQSDVNNTIRSFNEMFAKRETLQDKINKLIKQKRDLEYEKMRVDREVMKLVQETGKNESELVKEYVSQEEIQRMLAERSRLMAKRQELVTTIASLKRMVESIKREQEPVEALRKRYEMLKRNRDEKEAEYQKKRRCFVEKFREHMTEMFKILEENKVQIRHFNPQALRFERPGHTFSESERLIITVCYMFSLAKVLIEMGYNVPFLVIDVFSPMDGRFKKTLTDLVRSVPVKTIILVTENENSIHLLQ